MARVFVLLAALAAVLSVSLGSSVTTQKVNPDTVDTLDVPKFLGLWYQMAENKFVAATSEKDAYCATAEYGTNTDGTISVHNYATIGSPTGSPYIIDGYAYQTNPAEEPGQLAVVFQSPDVPPVPAPGS